jgi:hypothetical protein
MPNILGLIRKRRVAGKVLKQKEIEVWRNESEWNGALKKSDYTGGGQNPLAPALIGQIMARSGEGQMPNSMAEALKSTGRFQDMDSASDLWEALGKELRAITKGKAGFDPMDDPNYEPTDAEIAACEAKQASQTRSASRARTRAPAIRHAQRCPRLRHRDIWAGCRDRLCSDPRRAIRRPNRKEAPHHRESSHQHLNSTQHSSAGAHC